jgi:PAS domain S-box-containing protein
MAESNSKGADAQTRSQLMDQGRVDSPPVEKSPLLPTMKAVNYQQLADAIPQLVWVADCDGTLGYCNARGEAFHFWTRSPEGVWQWDSIVHPDDQQSTDRVWRESLRTGTSFQITHRLRGSDLTYRWYLSRAVPVRDPNGSISKWYGTTTDIEDERRVHADLLKRHERWRTFANVAFEGIVISIDGRIQDCNQQYACMLGYEPLEIIGLQLVDLHPPEERDRVLNHIRRGIEVLTEFAMLRKDGSPIAVEVHGRTVLEDGKPVRFSVVRDISSRKQYEQMLKNAFDDLEKKICERTRELELRNRELQELTHKTIEAMENDRKSLAKELHDSIGGTLSAIMYQMEARVGGMGQPPQGNHMPFEKMIEHLLSTITETRRISKRLRPHVLDDFGLVAAIRDFIRDFEDFYPNINITRQVRLAEKNMPDDIKIVLYRVIQEAFTNLGKHSGADRATIKLFKRGDAVQLQIHDNGDGFDAGTILSGHKHLCGFGLYNMKQRVELCRGRFHIVSGPGKGTCINIFIPLLNSK